jgi:hemolysin activation/secretion protein
MPRRGAFGRLRLVLLAAAAGSVLEGPVSAQTAPNIPVPTREELQRVPVQTTRPQPRRLTVEGDIERAPCPLANPEYAAITFPLARVEFNNLRGLTAADLQPAWAEYAGRTVPLATVCEIRDRAATILRRAGYLAAVQVPPQEIENGIVRLDVLMARIVAVQVRGDVGRSERTIAGFLRDIQAMPVFNEIEAERSLLLLRDLPGYDVRLTLRPAGTAVGDVVGEVTVVYTPFELDANIQNYGSRDVGRWGGLLRGQLNGLTGLGDRTVVSFFSTADFDEQQVVQLGHDFGLGNDGLRLAGRFTYAWTRPDTDPDLGIRSRTMIGGLEASYPFLRSQATNLYGAAGFELVDQEIEILDTLTNRDRLRIAYLRADFDTVDEASLGRLPGYSAITPRWRLAGSAEIRRGLDIFGATEFCATCTVQPSRIPGDATATVLRGYGVFEYRPLPKLTFAFSPRAQYSPDPLFAFEEFAAGNYTIGRGYDPGALIGDSGAGFLAELRYGNIFPPAFRELALEPFAFFDAAWVWNNEDSISGSERLYSAGGGVRAAFSDRLRLDVALAVPLSRIGLLNERPDPRILVSLTTRLLPWRRR